MKALLYRLHLLEPVLVSQAGAGEENSAIALPYIPGSAVRGVLVTRWRIAHPTTDIATDASARALFLDGTVCYLNAYPESEKQRTLPMPASWFVEKEQASDPRATIHDLAIESKLDFPIKPPQGGTFCLLDCQKAKEAWEEDSFQAVLISPERSDQVHITLKEVNRRGEGNQIYRYEALVPGQNFIGVILATDGQDLSEIRQFLTEGDMFLGTAHLAGYGRVSVEILEETQGGWIEAPCFQSPDDRIVVTLLSPTILRSDNGQVGWDGGQTLARSIGLPTNAKLLAAFGKTTLMGGYNRKWSLPLPQVWALTAGSVFVFKHTSIDQHVLQHSLDYGIGERRAEGYGRIAINWQVAAQISQREPYTYDDPAASKPLSEASQQLAKQMAGRRLRTMLDQALIRRVVQETSDVQNLPSNAQLSAIRQAALTGLSQATMQPLLDYLRELKESGKSQLDRCRMGIYGPRLRDWLEERSIKLDVEQQLLQGKPLPQVAGETAELTNELRVEYTSRLIDGVMRVLARQNREARQ